MDQVKNGKFIADLRKENGLTQQALGDELGVTNKTISRWENGVYMPDIEMLGLLSQRFQVSINELLRGERLNDTEFRRAADENLISISKASAFTVKEKTDFLKHKWLKEHLALILICVLFCAGILAFAVIRSIVWLSGATSFIWVIVFCVIRNKMMIYIEDQVYGQTNSDVVQAEPTPIIPKKS